MIDTNVKGLLNVTREWTPLMAPGSRIINIGSVAGRQAYPGGAVYNASKFAVHGLTQAMRMDLLPRGIQVAQVAPGAAETEFSMVRFKGDEAAANAVYGGYTPLSAEDVADAVMYIATRPEHVSIQDVLIACCASKRLPFSQIMKTKTQFVCWGLLSWWNVRLDQLFISVGTGGLNRAQRGRVDPRWIQHDRPSRRSGQRSRSCSRSRARHIK